MERREPQKPKILRRTTTKVIGGPKYFGRTNHNINDPWPVALILITYQDDLKQDETLQQLEEIQEYQMLIPDKSSSFVIDMVSFLCPFSAKQTLEVQWRL
jgi:hypothetical protein